MFFQDESIWVRARYGKAGRVVRSAQELVMSAGVGPLLERPGIAWPARGALKVTRSPVLRLPEDRAFDVDTINPRLARMAREAAPRAG